MPDTLPVGGAESPGTSYVTQPISGPASLKDLNDPDHVNSIHILSDSDVSDLSQHHTIGPNPGQAASGLKFAQHKHTGTDGSKSGLIVANQDLTNLVDKWLGIPVWYSQIIQYNPVDFNNAAFTDWLTGIVFPATGTLPLWAQDGTALIDIYASLYNVFPVTNAQTDNFRLVTNAVNGTAIALTVGAANVSKYTIGLQQTGLSIAAASTTVTTKVQANCTAGAIRFNAVNAASVLYQARVYK